MKIKSGRSKCPKAKVFLAAALLLCLVSAIFASAVQDSFGKVDVSELRLVDRSGYEVSALLYKPKTAAPDSPAPCIITVEGWCNNKEMQDLYSVEYARRGYVVLAVDMHGHGDSANISMTDLYTSAVGVDAAVELAGTLPYVDKNKIALTGHSSGGAACNMAIGIDNGRETPLISALLLQASTWMDDEGVDHSADYGERNIGIIADTYDEFYYWLQDEEGNPLYPRDFLRSPEARNFINFNNGYEGVNDAEAGRYYCQGDYSRVIYQPNCTHPWVHFSAECVGYGVDFFEDALGAPNPIPGSSQVWQWKTFFNFIGLVGIAAFILSFICVMLDTEYFGILKAESAPEVLTVADSAGKRWFWISLLLCALFSGVSYHFLVTNVMLLTGLSLFVASHSQAGTIVMGLWCLLSGLFTWLILGIYYKKYGKKNGIDLYERGVKMSKQKAWRTFLLAALTAALAFLILGFADYFFKSDFRIWVITLKAFDADKLLIGLKYMLLFVVFYCINSVAVNCFNYNNIGGKANILLLSFFNILGGLVHILIQYITFVSTGALMWANGDGQKISGIWLFPALVFLFVTPFMSRFIYKKTRNPYLCAIVNAAIITMTCAANTTTLAGF